MPLFQNAVLKKYLKQQDHEVITKAYTKFSRYFHNPRIQENIRSSKEEEYQGIFLTELFVKILGFTMKPNTDFNLVAEYKNEKNSKKADGAILKDDLALGVIELKGTNTKDLEKVRQQAFDYKANQSGCVYVITSNFEKIRFYINNAVDYEEFDLFHLNQDRFGLLYLCLAKENILNNTPLAIKEASIQEEEAITKKFYGAYSLFKRELYRNLVKLNMKNEVFRVELNNADRERGTKNIKQTLFKKSQKLIDRFLFIFFAEDRGLLPPNAILKILEQWNQLKELDEEVPLYNRYIKYFNYLDLGRKGTDKTAEIFAYNGGLFKPDAVLDSLLISDELLFKHTKDLSHYDFESQVDVNILGHIFENSLNEIESVNAEIEGEEFDKQKTKRKKDGVFYTPKYITKYIVDNTVGKLCEEKKVQLKILDEDFNPNRQKGTKKKLLKVLETYREWLLQLTILDPACGSGAFLNQALDFLIKEHHFIDELQTKLFGGGFIFPNIETTVLENNIFGVDLNEESVEIAKLSLWLRTAQPRRKLNDLSSNIKCGNSLIDSKSVAGDKAFKWEEEFSEIFTNGGFDVVIGNPPYKAGRHWADKDYDLHSYLKKKFSTADYQLDLYVLFYERSLKLLKVNEGLLSFIAPNTWFTNISSSGMREYFLTNSEITQILDCSKVDVFEDAVVETAIVTMKYRRVTNSSVQILQLNGSEPAFLHEIELQNWLSDSNFYMNIYVNKNEQKIKEKIESSGTPLGDFCAAKFGVKIYQVGKGRPKQTKDIAVNRLFESDEKLSSEYFKLLEGKDVNRYSISWKGRWIKYGLHLAEPRKIELFQGNRFLVRRIMSDRIIACCTDETMVSNALLHVVKVPEEYSFKAIQSIVTSTLMAFYFRKSSGREDKAFPEIKVHQLRSLPIITSSDSLKIEPLSDKMLNDTAAFYSIAERFSKYISSHFTEIIQPKKLQNWHELEFGDFIKELNKAIKKVGGEKLTKMDEMEWMDVFEAKKAEAQKLKAEIDKTDKEIDQMVYELYRLTEEEIEIVENS